MAEATIAQRRSTRHLTVDTRFAGLLQEDFGFGKATICGALAGEPQKEAIALCEWAATTDDPGKALTNWAKKNKRGGFRTRPAPTDREVEASGAFFASCMTRKRGRP